MNNNEWNCQNIQNNYISIFKEAQTGNTDGHEDYIQKLTNV